MTLVTGCLGSWLTDSCLVELITACQRKVLRGLACYFSEIRLEGSSLNYHHLFISPPFSLSSVFRCSSFLTHLEQNTVFSHGQSDYPPDYNSKWSRCCGNCACTYFLLVVSLKEDTDKLQWWQRWSFTLKLSGSCFTHPSELCNTQLGIPPPCDITGLIWAKNDAS